MPPKPAPRKPKTPFGAFPKSPSKTTPVKPQADTLHAYGFTALQADEFREEYAIEAVGMFVGPMPCKEFLDRFLPDNHGARKKNATVNFQDVPVSSSKEADLYEPLVEALNRCCTGLRFFVSASKGDAVVKTRPDIGMLNTSSRGSSAHTSTSSKNQAFDWARCELSCEVKRLKSPDPFDDDNRDTVENNSDKAKSHRGQLITYYKEQASHQQRTFIFQLFIRGPFARFLRWDRSGAVVSARFNYQKEPELLAGFLRRYANMTPRQRGWDLTKTLATTDEKTLDRKIEDFLNTARIQETLATARNSGSGFLPVLLPKDLASSDAALAPPIRKADRLIFGSDALTRGDYPTYHIQLGRLSGSNSGSSSGSPHGPQTRTGHARKTSPISTIAFNRPIYEPLSPFGCATRGYFAHDKIDDRIIFLKDTWRAVHPDPNRKSEGAVCQYLQSLGIRLVPTVLAYGDYKDNGQIQETLTNTLLKEDLHWRRHCIELRAHVHHYVVQEVLYPLTSVRNSRELVKIDMDILETLFLAHDRAKILHRDISIGNVMINANGEGVLGDWGNYGFVKPESDKHAPFRTGTWQFMAIDLLFGKTYNQLRHDLESASLWLPLYTALRFFPHNDPDFDMGMFDYIQEGKGESPATGGHRKRDFLIDQAWRDIEFECKPLNDLFQGLFQDWSILYTFASQGNYSLESGAIFKKKLAQLTSRDYVIRKFKTALLSDGWPEADVLDDQFPPMTKKKQGLKADAATREQITANATLAAERAAAGDGQVGSRDPPHEDGCDSPLTDWLYDSDGAPHLKEPSGLPRAPPPRPQRDSSPSESQSSSDSDDQILPTTKDKGKRVMRGTGLRREEPSPTPPARRPMTRRTTRPVGIGIGWPSQTSSRGAGPSNAPGTVIAPAAAPTDTQKRKVSQVDSTHSPKGAQKRGKNQKARKGKGAGKGPSKRR